MKKSLVAVLLSLVALTLVAGAAFAFDVTVKVTVDGGTAENVAVSSKTTIASKDFTAANVSKDLVVTGKITKEATKSVAFAVSEDKAVSMDVYATADGKLGDKESSTTVSKSGTYWLKLTSGDQSFAVEAIVTIGSEADSGDPVTKPGKTVLDAIKAYFKNATILDSESAGVTIKSITTSQKSAAKSEAETGSKKAAYITKLIVISPDISGDDLYFAFTAKLSDATEGHLLGLVKVPESKLGTSSLVEIAEDEATVFFSEAGKVIETVPADKTVTPAVPVKAGDSFVAVITTEERKGGGSPSGGCDMGLLGSLALFAVALLPLRKSR